MNPPEVLRIDTTEGLEPKKKLEPFQIYNEHFPGLKAVSADFNFENPQMNPEELAQRLMLTMKMYGGIGLAAIQCGLLLRVFALGCDIVCFNPKIISVSEDTNREKEGCLSFPGLFLPVTRANSVTLLWYDEKAQLHQKEFTGLTARTILHEYDHLDGKVFIDYVGKGLNYQIAKKKQKKLFKKAAQVQAIRERYRQLEEAKQSKDTGVLKIKTGI